MTELYYPVVAEQLNYEGLFSVAELWRVIDKYYRTKGFDKKIAFDEQFDTEKGKYFHLKTEYYKKVDSYVRLYTRLWIYINEVVDVEKEVNGKKIKTSHGKLSITFDAHIQTEYFNYLSNKSKDKKKSDFWNGLYFLIRVFYEQYINRNRVKYWEDVSRHVISELKAEISGYLNLNKFLYER